LLTDDFDAISKQAMVRMSQNKTAPRTLYDLVILDVGLPEYRWPRFCAATCAMQGVKSPFDVEGQRPATPHDHGFWNAGANELT